MRLVVLLLLLLLSAAAPGCRRQPDASDERERAYQANNRGVALLEQFRYEDAAQAFREALAIDESVAIARQNLSLALLYSQDLPGAAREAAAAARLLPAAPQPPYVLGLIARAENRAADAMREFERVRQIDAGDVGASVNLGQIYLEERRYAEAIAVLRPAVAAEPYNVTAAYNLGLALTRGGHADEGREMLARAQALRTTGYSVTFGAGYLEQGRYAEAMVSTGAEPELVPGDPPGVSFARSEIPQSTAAAVDASPFGRRFSAADLDAAGVQRLAAALGGGVALFDGDGDGDLDLFVASAAGERLFANDGGARWSDVTTSAGLGGVPSGAVAVGAVAADYDNDGAADLFVLRYGGSSLYRNDGTGRFTDVTRPSGLPPYGDLPGAAALTDVDHDGDLDLVIAGLAGIDASRRLAARNALTFPADFAPAPLRLLRNNGNGTFADITAAARLERTLHAAAIVPTDFDNRRDVDLLIVNATGPPLLYQNRRDGTFQDVAAEAGLSAAVATGALGAAMADVNKDDLPDFYFAGADRGTLVVSERVGRLAAAAGPDRTGGARAVQLADYDSDGVTDLLAWTDDGPHAFRNLGTAWSDESARAFPSHGGTVPSPRGVALGDVDDDGAIDIVTGGAGAAVVWRASVTAGQPASRSQRVRLRGRVSNRSAVGSKVQLRAGSLSTRFETAATTPPVAPASIVFGLGRRAAADTVRVLWPSGILQAETLSAPPAAAVPALPALVVEELDRKPSSCPFLYTWNGERFEFVTDFLGAGEMGYWQAPGLRSQPDPIEYVRIRGDQLRPRAGRFEVRVTNELEEALYVDRLELLAIDHPDGVEVYPNEGMTSPPKPFALFAVAEERVPRAVDDRGHDVTGRVARVDRRYPEFALERIRGYAVAHTLTLDLAPIAPGPPVLLLTGWTDYAFSSDNVAAHQAGLVLTPPALQIKDAAGRWRTAIDQIGIPVGRPQTVTVDLSGHLRPGEHHVRIVTSMRVYWDRIAVGRKVPVDLATSRLDPIEAVLRWRGFSAEIRPGGTEPPTYDYSRVSSSSPWKVLAGRYTREGSVRELLTAPDDMFVIARPGDEIALQFDAALAERPAGRIRTFLLVADGYSKEMDINSATPDFVEPLPFHRMTGYPYPAGERYPDTPEHRRYRDAYNTRVVVRPIPPVESASR